MARILVVDRDRRARSFYERELGRQRHHVHAVPGIHEGLQAFRAWEPDLLVLDIEIPDPWEVQAIKSMLLLNREIPVLFTSSLIGREQRRSPRARASRSKLPDDVVSMRQTIRELLRPRDLEASPLRRGRRVASLSAPRTDGHRHLGRHAPAASFAAQARARRALA